MTNWTAGMDVTAARLIDSTKADIATYTPAVTNGGSVTWSTQTGWYWTIGKLCMFAAYLAVNNAGSGASNITVAAPVSIDRTTRQIVTGNAEGTTAGSVGTVQAVAFTSGSAAVFNRVRNASGTNLTGAALQAGALLVFQGWIRQA